MICLLNINDLISQASKLGLSKNKNIICSFPSYQVSENVNRTYLLCRLAFKYKWPQPPGVAPILALQSIATSPVVRFQLDHYFACFIIIMQRLHLRWPTVVQPNHFTCGGYGCALIGFACHIFSVVWCGMLGCDMYV